LRLLLDEMISPRIARELRARGFDVQAIKTDRPELERRADRLLLEDMAAERRAIVTNNAKDFRALHDRIVAADEERYGIVFTYDSTMPRNKTAIPLWISALESLLVAHPEADALRNRIRHLL
jgi:predicted nuclease of predicted toxin-antitoxin system